MNETSDDRLKRLFAQAPVVAPDEGFVLQVASDVGARRSQRRVWQRVLIIVVAAGLAVLLAPFAPVNSIGTLGTSLLSLPDQLVATVHTIGQQPMALYVGVLLAAIALPLAAAAWLSRRL
jgi:uncharacterized membrane protein